MILRPRNGSHRFTTFKLGVRIWFHLNRVHVVGVYLTRQQFSLYATAHELAGTPGPTTSLGFVTLTLSVLVRLLQSLSRGSLLLFGSAITTRFHHQLPRQDFHLLVYQRTKAARVADPVAPAASARPPTGALPKAKNALNRKIFPTREFFFG